MDAEMTQRQQSQTQMLLICLLVFPQSAAKLLRAQPNSAFARASWKYCVSPQVLNTSGKPVEYKLKCLCSWSSLLVPQLTLIESNLKGCFACSVFFFFLFCAHQHLFFIIIYNTFVYIIRVALSCLSGSSQIFRGTVLLRFSASHQQFLSRQPSSAFSRYLFQTSHVLFMNRILTMQRNLGSVTRYSQVRKIPRRVVTRASFPYFVGQA